MLRQSPSRNMRTRGFKVKHACQICLLLTFFIWLLYQVRHSYYKRMEFGAPPQEFGEEVMKFGRKDLMDRIRGVSLAKGSQEEDLKSREDVKDTKVEEEEEEEDGESGVEGRGVGDDEIDVNDQEKADEEDSESDMEDLIDEEDQEKEDESLEKEVEGHSGSGEGSQVSKEDEKDSNESNSSIMDRTRGLDSVNGNISNREDPSFSRDRLIDQSEKFP